MSTAKKTNTPQFSTIESIKQDIEAMENNEATWTPEWMTNALMSAWHAGHSAGDLAAYTHGTYKQENPFMSEIERKAWYRS